MNIVSDVLNTAVKVATHGMFDCLDVLGASCESVAEANSAVTGGIVNAAGGLLEANPVFQLAEAGAGLFGKTIDVADHGVDRDSGAYKTSFWGFVGFEAVAPAGAAIKGIAKSRSLVTATRTAGRNTSTLARAESRAAARTALHDTSTTADNLATRAAPAAESPTVGVPKSTEELLSDVNISGPYKRPSGGTTVEQRASVQGKPCHTCNAGGGPDDVMRADHYDPYFERYLRGDTIYAAHDLSAVGPQCAHCSNSQGSYYSAARKALDRSVDSMFEWMANWGRP